MKRVLLIVLSALVVMAVGVAAYYTFGHYSKGFRNGYVMKLSHKGMVFKTWEGQLNVGGFDGGAEQENMSNVWDFSVRDQEIVDQLEDAVDTGYRVKLLYKEKFYTLPWWGDTKYFIYEVQRVDALE